MKIKKVPSSVRSNTTHHKRYRTLTSTTRWVMMFLVSLIVTPLVMQGLELMTNETPLSFGDSARVAFAGPQTKGKRIAIFAAGTHANGGYPTMRLLVNDQHVAVFDDVQGDPLSGAFWEFTYTHTSNRPINKISIQYQNDLYDTVLNQDRNLVVDKIMIDDQIWQTESPSTLMNGTYAEGQGCVTGYRQTEWLHCNGEITFAFSASSPQPTVAPTTTPIVKETVVTPTVQPTSIPAPQPVIGYPVSGYRVQNGQILNAQGQMIQLRGVNWFGFETETHSPHGLWSRNWKEMISQMKGFGFNAVRIPVCPESINGVAVTGVDAGLNPDLVGLNSQQLMDKIVREFDAQSMYVLLDHHRPNCTEQSELWYTASYSEAQWIQDLVTMAARYKNVSHFVGIDLKNEPRGTATWGTGNVQTDWDLAAERAGAAVLSANANLLIFVQGISEQSHCSSSIGHFWGENIEPINCKGIATDSIPADKLVLSPHVYGPDVFNQGYFNESNFPANMINIWNTHFGFAVDNGYAVVPGEWGGRYGNNGDPKDVTWHDALVTFFKSKKICSSFYWDWNPNSGDTGGVLQDDWTTPWANKVQMLQNYFNSCQS